MHISAPPTTTASPSLTTNALWLLSAKSLGFAFMFVLPILLVRQLNQHEFGVYKQVFLVVGTAVSLLPLGFGMGAYYFLPRLIGQRRHVVLNILLVHVAIAAVTAAVLTVWPGVLMAIFNDAGLVAYAPLIGLIILLWMPSSCLETLAVADGEAKLASRFIVVLQLSRGLLLISAAFVFPTVWALVVAAIVQGLIQSAVLGWYLTSRFAGYWRDFDWPVMRSQLSYGLPLGAATLLYWSQTDLHKYVVAHHFDAATYAIYAIGCFELPVLGILNESVGSVLIPRMSELQRDGRRRDIVRLAAGAMRKLAAVHIPMYAMLLVAGPQLMILLFTDQYLASWPIFAINITLIPFSLPTIPCDAVIRAHAEHRYFLVRLRLLSTALMAVGLWLTLDTLGLVGAISVVVVVNLFERLATTIKAARILDMSRADAALFGDTARICGAVLLAGIVAWATRGVLMPAGPVAVVVGTAAVLGTTYLGLLVLLGIPTASEWDALARVVARVRGGPLRPATIEPLSATALKQGNSRV